MAETISCRIFALKSWLAIGLFTLTALGLSPANAAPSPDLWPRWQTHVADDTQVVEYSPWDKLLATYLVANHPSGINRFRYAGVTPADRQTLADFLGYLQPKAFTAANTEELLEAAARAYVNSPRGARMEKGSLRVSSIYTWFQVDFGGSSQGVVKHLLQYAEGGLADALKTYNNGLNDEYDWRLNKE